MTQRQTFASNGFAPQISKNDWKKLKKGKTIYLRLTRPQINNQKAHQSAMTEVIRPYFYHKKMIAVVSIATFVSVVEENMHQLKINLAIAFLIATLAALLISYLLARSITKKIDQLRTATRQVAKGNYHVKVPVNGKDEVDDLARSFNQMTTALRESDQEIRRQEERRRKFLGARNATLVAIPTPQRLRHARIRHPSRHGGQCRRLVQKRILLASIRTIHRGENMENRRTARLFVEIPRYGRGRHHRRPPVCQRGRNPVCRHYRPAHRLPNRILPAMAHDRRQNGPHRPFHA